MKIYGDYTFLLDKLNVRNHSQVQVFQNGTKIVEFADQFIESQKAVSKDKVSISKEGLDFLRDHLPDDTVMEEGALPKDGTKLVMGDGLSLMDGLCRSYILKRLDNIGVNGASSNLYNEMSARYEEEMGLRDGREVRDHAESLARTHLAMQEKIREGYANGTREVWVLDQSTGEDFTGVEFEIEGRAVRYRKLTMEEELDSMEKAFGLLKEDVAVQLAKENAQKTYCFEEGADKKEDKEAWSAEDAFWKTAKVTDEMLDELEKLIAEIEELLKKEAEKPEDIGARLTQELAAHGAQIVADGQRQAQCANYRKMSKLTMDAQSLLGYIKA
ncbi:hypothetical protein AALD22_09725 [Lachnospiraceae bacterium 56-18]